MIQAFLVKKVAGIIIQKVMEKRAIKSMKKYVEEDNELDIKAKDFEKRLINLEQQAFDPLLSGDNLEKRIKKLEKKK